MLRLQILGIFVLSKILIPAPKPVDPCQIFAYTMYPDSGSEIFKAQGILSHKIFIAICAQASASANAL